MQHRHFLNCIFGVRVFQPVNSRIIHWVFNNINVFELGFIKMKNKNLVFRQSIFGNNVRFCQKMRQIILDRHIEIRMIHIFKQGFVRIFASMFDNILNFILVRFKETHAWFNQHDAAIGSPHFIAFYNHLFGLVFNPDICFQLFLLSLITKVIGENRRTIQFENGIHIPHNHHIGFDDAYLFVFF